MAEKSKSVGNSSPVRVLHLIDGLGGGGSERWLCDIVRLLPPEGFKHYVVTIHPDNGGFIHADYLCAKKVYRQPPRQRFLHLLQKGIHNLGGRPYLLPVRKSLSFVWHLGCYGAATRRVLEGFIRFRPDVIHVHTFLGFTCGLLLKLVFHRPMVHTVPALFSQMRDAGYGWMPRRYSLFHSWVDCFFTGASPAELLAVGIPASKIVTLRGAVDVQAVSKVQAERKHYYKAVRQALGLSSDAVIALSVGRLHASKGHLFALESLPFLVARFADLHWLVLGEGEQRAVLETRARELGVDEHVHLLGFRQDPLPYYAAADLYLRTSVFEAENLSSYQAMAMGLPVVGFDTGCTTELIRKVGHGILVPNRDVPAFSSAVARILLLPDKGRGMGYLGAEYCRASLDIQQTIAEFSSTYVALRERRAIVRPELRFNQDL